MLLRVTGKRDIGDETYSPGLYIVSNDNRAFGKRVSPEHAEQLIAANLAHYEGEDK